MLGISAQSLSKASNFDGEKIFESVGIHDPTDDDGIDDDLVKNFKTKKTINYFILKLYF